jgi:hypothetical protein
VIENWAQFIPQVMPVLFYTNGTDERLISMAKENQWKVLPPPRCNENGLPFFKDMYNFTRRIFQSTFYAYCNGDILFNKGLYETLQQLKTVQQRLGRSLIVGKRWNFELRLRHISSFHDVDNAIRDEATLFTSMAIDYFIVP